MDMIDGGHPVEFFPGHIEAGIPHAERVKDVFFQIVSERLTGEDFNDGTEDINGEAVHPLLAGLKGQRQLADPVAVIHGLRT